jgi:hypothetical protein
MHRRLAPTDRARERTSIPDQPWQRGTEGGNGGKEKEKDGAEEARQRERG